MSLSATRLTPNDVGHAGFKVPVTLVLSYANVQNLRAVGLMKVMWVKPDGTTEVMPAQVHSSEQVTYGTLSHFTDYGIGWP